MPRVPLGRVTASNICRPSRSNPEDAAPYATRSGEDGLAFGDAAERRIARPFYEGGGKNGRRPEGPWTRDRSRVNINEDYELGYWTKELGCTTTKLRNAVKAVGRVVENVRLHLKQQKG
jgi:hypothetical protein